MHGVYPSAVRGTDANNADARAFPLNQHKGPACSKAERRFERWQADIRDPVLATGYADVVDARAMHFNDDDDRR
jgi:hypothetical protein